MWLERVERSRGAEGLQPSRLEEVAWSPGGSLPDPALAGSCPHCLLPTTPEPGRVGQLPEPSPGVGGRRSHLGKENSISWVTDPLIHSLIPTAPQSCN